MIRSPEKVCFLFCVVLMVAGMVLPACSADKPSPGPFAAPAGNTDIAAGPPAPGAAGGNGRVRFSALPLSFIPNRGQYDPAVAFVVAGPESVLFFTSNEIVVKAEEKDGNGSVSRVVRQTFPGASGNLRITGADPLPGTANFFTGSDPAKWQAGIPTYGAVEYPDLYPGIDLRFSGNEGTLKREFIVAPGANPSVIRLHYEGIDTLGVDNAGALILTTGGSTVTESPLFCYQEINGKAVTVSAAYRVFGDHEAGLILGPYDPAFPLVIDPWLMYSSVLGGSGDDVGSDIAVDGAGNMVVTGSTASAAFPTTPGAFNRTLGGTDAFVTKLNPAGSALLYSTFIGGSGVESGEVVALDGSGDAYVTGVTSSPDFPVTALAYDVTLSNVQDAFVTKLNPAGSALLYSTYLGGSGGDYGYGIAVDAGGNASVTGTTYSADFPTTPGACNRTYGGSNDAYVTKLNAAGSGLVYSTYLGGSAGDYGYGIAVDAGGNTYVCGETSSPDLPTTAGGYDLTYESVTDAFVSKLNPDGSALVYSTYLGGPGPEWGNDIAVDGSGNVFVTGHTGSAGFPTTAGAYNRTIGGAYDAYVTKLNAAGSGLIYSTYLGGSGSDNGRGLSVDGSGNAYISGQTDSPDLPTTAGAYNRTLGGPLDAYVAKLNPAGTRLLSSTYLGGSSDEYGSDCAIDNNSSVYVIGRTNSPDFPTTAGGYDITYNGNFDVFVARFFLPGSEIGVFRNSTHLFYLDYNGNGAWNGALTDKSYSFGISGDIPVTGDWNNDGRTEIGVFRPATHLFYLDYNGNGAWNGALTDKSYSFGISGDIPVTGDWNNDGRTEIGVFRPATHLFYLDYNGNGAWNGALTDKSYSFGITGDIPVTGDWNSDGITEIGVFRPATHLFYLDYNGNGAWNGALTDKSYSFGISGDIPITGDWNADGKSEIGVFRPATHLFYLDWNGNGAWNGALTDKSYSFGISGDTPVAGAW